MWNGKYFCKMTLHEQGYILHLGHHGGLCPATMKAWTDEQGHSAVSKGKTLFQSALGGKCDDILEYGVLNIVHTTGVFQHRVRWCQCQDAPERAVQLFRMRLFSSSHIRPETAFTFDVLDHFHIDAMECKTAAASFVKKLCRLTNNAFPHTVPVSTILFQSM